MALAMLGDTATVANIEPPDASVQANYCSMFYNTTKQEALETHPWTFATYRHQLALLGDTPSDWEFVYGLPADFMRLVKVLDADGTEIQFYTIERGSTVALMTNVAATTLLYISSLTPESKFSGLFTRAFATLLASYLAGPILKNDMGVAARNKLNQEYMTTLGVAKQSDGFNHSPEPPVYIPSGVAARA
jgi:hypothetical protein